MKKKKEFKQVEEVTKLDINKFLQLSINAVSNFIEKEISFFVGDQEYTVDVGLKLLSYDEVVNLMKGKDPQKVLMADLIKAQVVASIFNLDTKKPLFTEKTIGTAAPQIVDALHQASDEVNDFSGKYLMEKLTKKNSGANSSLTESVEEQLQPPNAE